MGAFRKEALPSCYRRKFENLAYEEPQGRAGRTVVLERGMILISVVFITSIYLDY